MTFIVATNVIASRPPERRPTGTPYARAKMPWTEAPSFVSMSLFVSLFTRNVGMKEKLRRIANIQRFMQKV